MNPEDIQETIKNITPDHYTAICTLADRHVRRAEKLASKGKVGSKAQKLSINSTLKNSPKWLQDALRGTRSDATADLLWHQVALYASISDL